MIELLKALDSKNPLTSPPPPRDARLALQTRIRLRLSNPTETQSSLRFFPTKIYPALGGVKFLVGIGFEPM